MKRFRVTYHYSTSFVVEAHNEEEAISKTDTPDYIPGDAYEDITADETTDPLDDEE